MADYADLTRLRLDGGRPLSDADENRATLLLGKASRMLAAEFKLHGSDLDALLTADAIEAELVADVVCDMVRRALPPQDGPQVTQQQQTAPGFSWGQTFAAPSVDGAMFLTRADRRKLGLKAQRARTVDLFVPPSVPPYPYL